MAKVAFPEREKDGCTHCGTVLTVFNNDGSVDVAASERAQQSHHVKACAANPASDYAEYPAIEAPAASADAKLSDDEKDALGKYISEQVAEQVAAQLAAKEAAASASSGS